MMSRLARSVGLIEQRPPNRPSSGRKPSGQAFVRPAGVSSGTSAVGKIKTMLSNLPIILGTDVAFLRKAALEPVFLSSNGLPSWCDILSFISRTCPPEVFSQFVFHYVDSDLLEDDSDVFSNYSDRPDFYTYKTFVLNGLFIFLIVTSYRQLSNISDGLVQNFISKW